MFFSYLSEVDEVGAEAKEKVTYSAYHHFPSTLGMSQGNFCDFFSEEIHEKNAFDKVLAFFPWIDR